MTAKWPPGERGLPVFGRFFHLRRDPLIEFMRLRERHGDIAYIRIGPQNAVLLSHPDQIQEVLVTHAGRFRKSRILERARVLLGDGLLTAEGRHHTKQRKLIQPAFYQERLKNYAAAMSSLAEAACAQWRAGEQRDLSEDMMALTLSIVSNALFSSEVGGVAADVAAAMKAILESFSFMLLPGSRHLERFPVLPVVRKSRSAMRRLDEIVRGIIRSRIASGRPHDDLLGLLLDARYEDGAPMSEQQIRDEVLTIFLAGHETTANALAWTFYLLDRHPAADEVLQQEIRGTLSGRLPELEDVERLTFARSVFAESLRLYPPAWALGRRAVAEHQAGSYRLQAGTIVVLSPYVTHRHPEFWPDPERFDPSRHTPSSSAARPKFAYFPFGGGPRVCIGERFAWMEGVLVLATLARRWRFRVVDPASVEPQAVITLRPRGGLRVRLEARPNAPRT